jgi:hypothetical protein
MRNPERIPLVLAAIGEYWSLYPDLRLGQLLGNFEVGYNTEDETLMRALAMPELLQTMEALEPVESFEDKVERIARAYFESPCPPDDGPCNPGIHDWDTGHPGDKAHWRTVVRFVLTEAGIE